MTPSDLLKTNRIKVTNMFKMPFILLYLSLVSLPAFGLPIVLDQIAAIVDDDIITRSEVTRVACRAMTSSPNKLLSGWSLRVSNSRWRAAPEYG